MKKKFSRPGSAAAPEISYAPRRANSPRPFSLRALQKFLLLLPALALALAGTAQAQTYTWNQVTGAANWQTTTDWNPTAPATGPSGAGVNAYLTSLLTAAETVSLNGGAVTLGNLSIGPTGGLYYYTLAPGTGGTLTMNNSGAGATITHVATGGANNNGDTISAPIVLADNLTVINASGGVVANSTNPVFTISGGITSTGTENLTLDNNSSSYNLGNQSYISLTTTAINNSGTVTNNGTGTGAVFISAAIGNSVTGVAQDSTTSVLYLSGANTYTTGTTIASGATIVVGASAPGVLNVIGAAGTAGNLGTGGVTDNGTLIYDRSDAVLTDGNVITGSGGVTSAGAGTVTLSSSNTYTGATTINNGTLASSLSSNGTPFGTGAVVINGGKLSIAPATPGTVALTGASQTAGTQFTYAGPATVVLSKGTGGTSLTYTVGPSSPTGAVLNRTNNGTLILQTASADLGTGENFVVTGTAPSMQMTNNMVNASIVGQVAAAGTTAGQGNFLTYGAASTTGFSSDASAYTNISGTYTTVANEIGHVTGTTTITDSGNNPYALVVGAGNTYTATLSGTVTVGNNSDPAGVILNGINNTAGDTITGGTLAFGAAEGIIYSFDSTATTVGTGNVVNSSITGTGGVTAAGTSNLTLGGAFSVSSLNLNNINNSLSGSATLFISGAITGTGNLTVTSNGSNVTNISSAISNTGNLVFTQNGSSSLSLSAGSNAVNNTGTITFNGNTTANPAFANGAIGPNVTQIIQDDPNDTLSIGLETGTGEDAYSVTILAGEVNNAASAWGTGAITLGAPNGSANAMLYDNGATINNAINVGASTGTMTINGHGSTGNLNVFNGLVTLSSASSILTVTGNNQSITFSGGTTGPGNILVQTYNSNGTFFTTNAVNNGGYIEDAGPASGPLTISGGVGSSVTELIENSATSAFSVTTTALTVNSSGTTLVNNATAGATTLTVSSTISGSGNLTLDNDTSTNGAIVIPNSASLLTYSGSLINNGTGTGSETVLNLGASITGVAQDSNTSPFTVGQMSAAGNVNLIENGTAALNFTNGNNTGTITASGSGTGTITLGSLASTVTALTVNSAGGATLVVQGNNTTFAPTSNIVTVTSGALDAHPTTSTASALNTATVDLGAGSGSATAIFETDQSAAGIANLVSVGNNSGTNEISNTNNIGAAFSGAVTLNGGNGVTFVSTGTTGTTAETGGIAGTGNVTLDPNGSAAIGITVSGSNDVNNTGAVIDNGTGASAALITANIDSTVNAITENSATSPFNITTGIITVNSSGTTLTDNAASGTAGVLTVSAAITGAGNLTLDNNSAINNGIALSSNNVGNTGRVINNGTGTGTETLTGLGAAVTGVTQSSATSRLIMQGTYSYTGTTQVTAGVLDVTGTLAAGTATSVSSGATLEGTGTLRGSVVVASGGYLAPGTGGAGTTGTLATGTTDITSANLTFALNSTTSASDLLAVSGNLTLGGANLLASDLGSTALSPGTVFTVASYTGTLSGTFAGLVNGSNIVIGVNTYQINYGSLSNSDITLDTVNAVPEPSTWAMLIGGLVVLLIHVRLRRPRVLAETE